MYSMLKKRCNPLSKRLLLFHFKNTIFKSHMTRFVGQAYIYAGNTVTATFNNSCKVSFFHELRCFLNTLYNYYFTRRRLKFFPEF